MCDSLQHFSLCLRHINIVDAAILDTRTFLHRPFPQNYYTYNINDICLNADLYIKKNKNLNYISYNIKLQPYHESSDSVSNDLKAKEETSEEKERGEKKKKKQPSSLMDSHWPHSPSPFPKLQTSGGSLPTTLGLWQGREVADVEEIQEYFRKDLVFHDYSLERGTRRRKNTTHTNIYTVIIEE